MTATFTTWLQASAAESGAGEALVEPAGETVSFADLERRVAGAAGWLASLGLGRGDRLASLLPNGALPVEIFLAAARLGAVTIGVNTRYRSEDLRHVVERARPRLLVGARTFLGIDFEDVVSRALEGLASPPQVVWSDGIAGLRGRHAPVHDDRALPSDPVVAFTTSGTTGRPKLAAHDHETTLRHLHAAARSLDVGAGSTGLLVLPFCGTFGFVSLMSVLAGGGRVVVPDHFDAASAAALVESHGVTHVNGSDDMLLAVLDQGRKVATWRHGVHAEFTGRGFEVVARADAAGVRLTGVYGSSETFALLTRRSPDGTVAARAPNGGPPVDAATEIRTVDTATGAVMAPGEPGELQLRGPSLLGGYLVEDGVAPPPLTPDGWFSTGDLASADGDGGFTYLARLGDSLRLAGFLTDPAEIEQHLLTHPQVRGAQVVGAPKPGGGEAAVAFVVTTAPVEEPVLLAHCRQGLANYKVPARIVAVEEFPVVDGANGVKVRKSDLRAQAAELLG
ncbi:MAG: AMP-binding protein [Acidimicrobiales bacterium]